MRPVLLVIGTRPEGIKMIPLYFALKRNNIPTLLCSTSQHAELLSDIFTIFDVKPDFELAIMKPHQDLFYLTQALLQGMKNVLEEVVPSLMVIQGDTTTAMTAALAAFYKKIPIAHIEAGLRTHDLYSPFPEEMNRHFITLVSSYHFAPTAAATANVLACGVHRDLVFCTGNTVVDALYFIQNKIAENKLTISTFIQTHIHNALTQNYKLILLTMHRRESFTEGVERVLRTVLVALERFENLLIIYPRHPNPHIKEILEKCAFKHERFIICDPLSYSDLMYTFSKVNGIMTDSGGIQEEATSLGKPVIVLREKTERMEGVWAGYATLVGTDSQKILEHIGYIVRDEGIPFTKLQKLYGDGHAAEYISQIIMQKLSTIALPEQIKHISLS